MILTSFVLHVSLDVLYSLVIFYIGTVVVAQETAVVLSLLSTLTRDERVMMTL